MSNSTLNLKDFVRDVPDFPEKGILFRDIGPLLASPEALTETRKQFLALVADEKPTKIAAIDARGFTLAGMIASDLNAGIVMVRKPGKLPGDVVKQEYVLEYGRAALEIQKDAIRAGERVLIIDDVIAIGGTAGAAIDLVRKVGGEVTSVAALIELRGLKGREKINSPETVASRGGQTVKVHSVLQY